MCNNMGYKGRIGVFELMLITDEMRGMIMNSASTDALRDKARSNGMRGLRDVGLDFIYDGTTTCEEIIRETMLEA
jgi:type IV pilus assembly protein PilB